VSVIVFLEKFGHCDGYFIIADSSIDAEFNGAIQLDHFEKKIGRYDITFVMNLDLFKDTKNFLDEKYPVIKGSVLNWYYNREGRQSVQEIKITDENIIKDEYYPFIKGGVNKLIDDFIASKESILLLIGPPGTGKTSLIRNMIVKNKFHACMTYDESVYTSDKFYIDYLLNKDNDMLIVEDADLLLEDRVKENNKTMSKILNAGDGLAKMPNKKMIFTTNITDIRKIDPALMRPGRCFGVVMFRPLTQEEADSACVVAGMPAISGKKEYSLADIFSRKENQITIRKIGYV
jgi:hypothetical protein